VSCSEAIVNGGFEEDEAWIFGNTPRPGRYTSEEVYLGHRSAILGIQPPQSDAYSWSSVRQRVTIPADADVASLSFWYKPFTEEPPALNWQMVDGGWPIADGEWPMADGRWWIADGEWQMGHRLSDIGYRPPVVGYSDRQEALILEEQFPNPAVLGILMRLRSNSQAWSRQTHDLTAYAGQTINVYFNAFNNGQGGLRTWMYLDEVSLKICINVPQ